MGLISALSVVVVVAGNKKLFVSGDDVITYSVGGDVDIGEGVAVISGRVSLQAKSANAVRIMSAAMAKPIPANP